MKRRFFMSLCVASLLGARELTFTPPKEAVSNYASDKFNSELETLIAKYNYKDNTAIEFYEAVTTLIEEDRNYGRDYVSYGYKVLNEITTMYPETFETYDKYNALLVELGEITDTVTLIKKRIECQHYIEYLSNKDNPFKASEELIQRINRTLTELKFYINSNYGMYLPKTSNYKLTVTKLD